MVAFPKVGFAFKLRCDISPINFISSRMVASRIIESGELLTKEQVLRYYGLSEYQLSANTLARLSVFSRLRVVFWDFTNSKYRIYPWDTQTAKRIWERLVPIGQTDPETVPTVEVNPEDKDRYHKAATTYEIRKSQLKVGELWMMDGGSSTGVSLDPKTDAQFWAETARIKAELSALKATLRKRFPSLKFD